MKRRRLHGFTLVEIAIVIAIISILASVVLVVSNNVQVQARDQKRVTDMKILQARLEKYYDTNGTYPSSCEPSNYNAGTQTCLINNYVPGPAINASTTNTTLSSLLGTIDSSTRDPRGTNTITGPTNNTFSNDTSINSQSGQFFGYVYLGSYYNPSGSGQVTYTPSMITHGIICRMDFTISDTQVTAALLGYYSESEDKFYIIPMRSGVRPTLVTTSYGGNDPARCRLKNNL